MKQRRALWLALVLALSAPQACQVEEADGCSDDEDCKGDRVCDDGECVDRNGQGAGSCNLLGESCEADSCCNGAICVHYTGAQDFTACEARCTSSAECGDGCCSPVGTSGESSCSPAPYCSPGGGGSGGYGGGTPGPSGGSGGTGGSGVGAGPP